MRVARSAVVRIKMRAGYSMWVALCSTSLFYCNLRPIVHRTQYLSIKPYLYCTEKKERKQTGVAKRYMLSTLTRSIFRRAFVADVGGQHAHPLERR